MNLGLALIKPAESDLGVAMRLWLVNRATWKLTPLGWNQRVAAGIASNPDLKKLPLTDNAKGLRAVRQLQALLCEQDSTTDLRLAGRHYFRRNCPECARAGYHCVYFDYPWLQRCPVHKKALVRHCPDCGKLWPSAIDVHSRQCDCCGIRKPIEKLMEHGSFEIAKFTSIITPLISFFTTQIKSLQIKRSFNFHIETESHDRFARTLSFPSVLAKHAGLSKSTKQPLVNLGLDLQPCYIKRVALEEITLPTLICHGDEERKIVNKCRARISRLVNRALKRIAGHNLGTCDRNVIHRHFNCVYCESWRQWNQGFERNVEIDTNQSMFTYHPPFARRVSVRDPGLVISLFDYESSTYYRVPVRIQRLIYQIELWLCFRKMIAQIEFYLRRPFDPKQSYASYSGPDRDYLSHEQHHFGYFYFVKQSDHTHLIFPKAYADDDLNNSERLLSLFREPA